MKIAELVIFAAACAALLVASVLVTAGELSPFVPIQSSIRERVEGIARNDLRTGISSYSKTAKLRDCVDGLNSVYAMSQPTGERERIVDACDALSKRILSSEPGNAFAWYAAAQVAAERRNDAAFNDFYSSSQRMAPNELWLAALRVDLAQRSDLVDDGLAPAYASDIATMATSLLGAKALAALYLGNPASQDDIEAVVITLPQKDQQRFLSWVERGGTGLGRRG